MYVPLSSSLWRILQIKRRKITVNGNYLPAISNGHSNFAIPDRFSTTPAPPFSIFLLLKIVRSPSPSVPCVSFSWGPSSLPLSLVSHSLSWNDPHSIQTLRLLHSMRGKEGWWGWVWSCGHYGFHCSYLWKSLIACAWLSTELSEPYSNDGSRP